ncbi:CocE/NonD family hydrolase [Granulicella tundricola]|uniref:Hydrolase CocE/NonD family protein n=1 Tax=Granulicella tundricola (strain ATCC BAA-1859 / DSM 23138 / MP5ACTX9) TaxID=1198114 RepID=E8X398_GRATM|nr:CocE/NonD family hydrolase [Granulicella tundricola]ADW70399.1 hydrolase CocE/NonD family protein [Granulicella tundricola MP5ACTX9]
MRLPLTALLLLTPIAFAQGRRAPMSPEETQALIAKRQSIEKQLEDIAVIDRKVMVPMRDGIHVATDIYRPKDTTKTYPIIFSRTPYNFNFWDVRLGTYRDMSQELDAVKRGYVLIEMNERGHFFSEGNYDILGAPLTDADDQFNWMGTQPWSNGKVGLIGCSSTAEWQMAAASLGNKHLTTIIPQSFGAGVGKVGPYNEQGNWYRGGAVQMLFIDWLAGEQNQIRPNFPPGTSQADLIQGSKLFDLSISPPPVDWAKAFEHLPEKDIISAAGGPKGIFSDKMPNTTGGAMIERTPNDPAWRKGGLWQSDTMPINVPGFWFMTWYDVSIGPNLAAYNFVRSTAKGEAANQQYAVIAPTLHCGYTRATEHTVVGERDMGDARLDWGAMTYAWFDHFLKGEDNKFLEKTPKVQYYTMGLNKWQHSETWPPEGAKPVTLTLASAGHANTLHGDGKLIFPISVPVRRSVPTPDVPDHFTYDPMHPTPSYGGNVCCAANTIPGMGGALDQRKMEERDDILVYTSDPLTEPMELSGPITATLYVSSDVKDTDVTVKLIDVDAEGKAYNLDETIQRLRYREGDDKMVWMEKDKVYKVTLTPMNTSNLFPAGHRIRLEVAGSNFPRFDRNLNTGGNNYDETTAVTAHTAIHHSTQYPSTITVTVAKH